MRRMGFVLIGILLMAWQYPYLFVRYRQPHTIGGVLCWLACWLWPLRCTDARWRQRLSDALYRRQLRYLRKVADDCQRRYVLRSPAVLEASPAWDIFVLRPGSGGAQ